MPKTWMQALAEYGDAGEILRDFRRQAQAAGVVRCALYVVPPFHSLENHFDNPFWWGYSEERKSFYVRYRVIGRNRLAEMILERGQVVLTRDAMDWVPQTDWFKSMRAEALTHHAEDGVAIPIFGPFGHRALLIISFGEHLADTNDARIEPIRQLAIAGHRAVMMRKRAEQLPHEALTPTEIAVLRGVGKGASNKEISRKMKISIHNVDANLRRIFAKLGTTTRLQASFRAMELGLLRL